MFLFFDEKQHNDHMVLADKVCHKLLITHHLFGKKFLNIMILVNLRLSKILFSNLIVSVSGTCFEIQFLGHALHKITQNVLLFNLFLNLNLISSFNLILELLVLLISPRKFIAIHKIKRLKDLILVHLNHVLLYSVFTLFHI